MPAPQFHFHDAKKSFEENLKQLGSAATDPLVWHLNTGLLNLAQGIEGALQQIREEIAALRGYIR
jgi:hypothetical protein